MKKFGLFVALSFLPVITFADVENLQGLVAMLVSLVNSIIPLLFGLALLAFFWGVIGYIRAVNPAKIKEAYMYMTFSIVSIAVMLSVWGLALFLKNSFFPSANSPYDPSSGRTRGPVDYTPNRGNIPGTDIRDTSRPNPIPPRDIMPQTDNA